MCVKKKNIYTPNKNHMIEIPRLITLCWTRTKKQTNLIEVSLNYAVFFFFRKNKWRYRLGSYDFWKKKKKLNTAQNSPVDNVIIYYAQTSYVSPLVLRLLWTNWWINEFLVLLLLSLLLCFLMWPHGKLSVRGIYVLIERRKKKQL